MFFLRNTLWFQALYRKQLNCLLIKHVSLQAVTVQHGTKVDTCCPTSCSTKLRDVNPLFHQKQRTTYIICSCFLIVYISKEMDSCFKAEHVVRDFRGVCRVLGRQQIYIFTQILWNVVFFSHKEFSQKNLQDCKRNIFLFVHVQILAHCLIRLHEEVLFKVIGY